MGDAADVAQVTTEGGFVHLDGVVLPLGPRGLVSLERATAAIGGSAQRAAGLPEARLHAFRGVIRFGDTGEPSFVADVVFRAEPHPDERAWIAGELVIERASWTPASGMIEARAMRGAAKLFVTSTEWRLEDGALESERARVRFAGRGALDSSASGGGVADATLVLEEAKVGPFLDAASAIIGRTIAVPPGVPIDAGITGELGWSGEGGGRGELAIDAEGLEIRARGKVGAEGRGLDAHVEARVRPAVVMRSARLSPKLLPRDEDELRLDLAVSGETSSPVVKGTVRADEIVFRAGRPRFAPPAAVFRELVCELAAEGEQALARATARAGAGLLTMHLDVPIRDPRRAQARAWVKDLDAGWVSALLSAVGARMPLPRDAQGSVELLVTRDEVKGEASVVTPRSRIAIAPLVVRGRALEGTRLAGDVSFEDALTLGLADLAVRPLPDGTINVDLAIAGTVAEPSAEGVVVSPRLYLVVAGREDAGTIELLDARGAVEIGRRGARFTGLSFRAYDAALKCEATIPFASGQRAVATFRGEGGAAFAAAAARFVPRRVAVAPETRVSGEVTVGGGARVEADVAIETGAARGTALAVRFVLGRDGRVDGSTLRGHIGLADVVSALPADARVRLAPIGAATIDAELSGPSRAIVVAGWVAADLLRLSVGGPGAEPFVLTGASGLVRFASGTIVWHKVEANAYAGAVASAGVVRREGGSLDLVAKVGARDVAIEALPIGAPGNVERFVTGRLGGAMRVERRHGSLAGRGRLVLDEAFFPVLTRARGELGRYGLEPPHPRANAPATVDVVLDDGGVLLRSLRASVPGCLADGDVRIGLDGALDGALTVTLEQEYLASSAVLVLPSVFAERLTLPVEIGGSVREPRIDADLAACFGRFMTENRVSAFVSDAVEEVASLFGTRPPPREAAPPPEPIAQGDEDLVRELEGARPDWTRVEPRLEEHRRRARRVRVGGSP